MVQILSNLLDPTTAARLIALSDRQTAVRIPFKRGHAPGTWLTIESLFAGYGEHTRGPVPVTFAVELLTNHIFEVTFFATGFWRDVRYPMRVTLMGSLTDDSRTQWQNLQRGNAYAAAKIAARGPSGLLVLPREFWAAIVDTYSHMHHGAPNLPDQDVIWRKW